MLPKFKSLLSCIFFAFSPGHFLFVIFTLSAHFSRYFICGQRFPREIHLSRHLYVPVDGMRNRIQMLLKIFGLVRILITLVRVILFLSTLLMIQEFWITNFTIIVNIVAWSLADTFVHRHACSCTPNSASNVFNCEILLLTVLTHNELSKIYKLSFLSEFGKYYTKDWCA